jgi:hypothetical protein
VSSPRPGRRVWEGRISLAPHPSMAEDRIRYQVPAFEKPAHGVCIHLTGGAWIVYEIHWGMKAGLGDKAPVVPRPAR